MIRKLGESREEFVKRPGRDFTRPRTLTFETVISLLLTMSENSIGKVLMERFQNNEKTPSASAFVQQRQKLLPSALETLFHRFTGSPRPEKTFRGYHLLAGDGSSLKSAAYPEDSASYRPGTPRQYGWNLWHMNALYDLENGIYTDLVVQKEHEKNERKALCQMVDRSVVPGNVILLADRNYESRNNLAHLEKKGWNYLIRMEHTGRYYESVALFLHDAGFFVSALNPIVLKDYQEGITVRRVKTDKADAAKIARFALDNWEILREYTPMDTTQYELKTLNRQFQLASLTIASSSRD